MTLAGVMTAAAAGAVASRATATPSQAARQEQPSPGKQETGTDLFIKRDASRAHTGSDLLDAYFQSKRQTPRKDRLRDSLEVIIATLPDPLDSHLDYEFDAELAAMRQAVEVSGYVIDRFWLPWPVDREKAELATRLNRIDTTTYRRHHPGVVLFRQTEGTGLLLLYLVGDVPTSGMQVDAFDAALADRRAVLSDPRIIRRSRKVRVIGPAFTGGATPLREALVRLRRREGLAFDDSIVVISGSATGTAVKQIVDDSAMRISYHATVHSDAVLERVERNVLCKRLKIRQSEIALLKESSTQYGALSSTPRLPPPARGKAVPRIDDDCTTRALEIPFPANISNLRSEYARAPAQLQNDASIATGSSQSRIQLNLQDPSRAMEHPQVMSTLTPAIVDGLLDQVAQTLSAHHIRAVGIIATDARDKLFLAEQLRKRMHDLTLFTTESNILLVRRDVNASLRGMLVFATYPLQLDAQRWDTAGVGRHRYAFASDGAEGVFNAARLQVSDSSRLAEYGVAGMGDAPLYCDYGFRYTGPRGVPDAIPPVWVLAVGRSGFFPITACRTGNANNLMPLRPASNEQEVSLDPATEQVSTWLTSVVLYALTALILTLELRQFLAIEATCPAKREDNVMREVDWRLLIMQRHLYAMLRVLAFATIVSGLGIGIAHRLGSELSGQTPLAVAATLSAFVVVTLSAVHAMDAMRSWIDTLPLLRRPSGNPAEKRSRLWAITDASGRAIIFIVASWFAVNAVAYIVDIHELELTSPLRQELLLHRAGVLDGGFSPAMMLALVGGMFFLWCSWHISRIQLLLAAPSAFEWASSIESDGVTINVAGAVSSRWHNSMRAVRTHLVMLVPDAASFAVFVLLLLLALGLARKMFMSYEALLVPIYRTVLPFSGAVLMEGTRFDFLVRFGVASALAATAWALFRASRIWGDLQRTLGKLGRLSLVTAFERLPRRVARLTRLNVLRPHAEALVLSISAAQAAHMRQIYRRLSLAERQALAKGLQDVRLPRDAVLDSREYLNRLMLCGPARTSAWGGKKWTHVAEVARESDHDPWERIAPWIGHAHAKLVADSPSCAEEALAVRYLLDLVERRHRDEPAAKEVEFLLEHSPSSSEMSDATPRSTSGQIRRTFGTEGRLWLRSAEELVAVQAVDYIQWVMQHLRYLTLYIVGSLVIITEMLAAYVLQPSSTLWLMLILLVLVAVVTLVGIVVQMNRNEVLSRINGTVPGTITWDVPFVTNLTIIGIVPALTFVGSAVPWLHDALFSWLDPLLRAFGRH